MARRQGQDEILDLICEESEATTLRLTCQDLLSRNQFVDVTLSCVDGQIQAHRLVLCAVSGYLYELFTANPTMNPCTHPMIILRDCKVSEVESALQYVYGGRTRVESSKLGALLNVARELGCESLEGAINRALQSTQASDAPASLPDRSCGSPTAKAGDSKITSLLSQITKAIKIKTEPDLDNGTKRHSSRSRSQSPSSSRGAVPPMPKLLRMTPSPAASTSSRPGQASPPVLMRLSSSQSRPGSELQLQHDKAESFEYTNENLDMMLFGDDDEGGNDLDQSEENPCPVVQIKTEPVEVNDKLSSCPWCNQLFGGPLELQRHIKSLHTNTSSHKPYACPYCSHEFARSAHLKRHIRCLHTSEKPYKCDYCDKDFSRQDKMKIHMNRHLQGSIPMNNTNNDELVRTCYPPASMSQNSGGQVPIKILIPKNNGGTTSNYIATGGLGIMDSIFTQFQTDSSPALSPSSFFNDGATSITINAPIAPKPSKPTALNQQTKRQTQQLNSFVN